MKNKSYYSADDKLNEIDVSFFLSKLWNRKILILFISIIFALLSYFYSLFEGKKYKTTVWLKTLSEKELFLEFTEIEVSSLDIDSIQTNFKLKIKFLSNL
jgi:LPS O-antigen subunit length determinant protein (WzzB/FepE family)